MPGEGEEAHHRGFVGGDEAALGSNRDLALLDAVRVAEEVGQARDDVVTSLGVTGMRCTSSTIIGPSVNGTGRPALYQGMGADTMMVLVGEEVRIAAETEHDFDRLFREEGPGVWRTIYAFTGGRRDLAEEAVAEAFARAIAHASSIRDPLRWIYRVAFRVAREELRRECGRGPQAETVQAPPELNSLMQALRELSPNQRAAIVLRHVADLDVGEVARRMGIAAPTVRVHLHRGRNRLRQLLGADDVD